MANLELSRAKRLDQYVIEQYPLLSRAYAKKLCDDGSVQVNGRVEKAGYKLRPGDTITIDYNESEAIAIPDIELPVLYEDDDCLVINKPIGILTHSKGIFNPEATVASFIRARVHDMGGERPGIVHRLDRATSGVIICAKNPAALSWLQKQFSQRRTKKTYMAITEGHLQPAEAIIDMPIERNPKRPQTFRVGLEGKPAVTAYEVVESRKTCELVKLSPTTGRTHQLRVHLKHLGHPIVGDPVYGNRTADRLYLHALSLEITLPNRERKTFTAELPEVFKVYLERDHA